jgi:hypothetical protein
MYWLSPFFNMEAKFGTSEKKRINKIDTEMKFFIRNSQVPSFWLLKEGRNFGRAKVEPVDGKLKKIKIKLATTGNENERQDAQNDAEL